MKTRIFGSEEARSVASQISEIHGIKGNFEVGVTGSFAEGSNKKASAIDFILKKTEECEDELVGSFKILKIIAMFMDEHYDNKYHIHWYDLISDDEEKKLKLAPEVGVGKNPGSVFVNMVNTATWIETREDEDLELSDSDEDDTEDDLIFDNVKFILEKSDEGMDLTKAISELDYVKGNFDVALTGSYAEDNHKKSSNIDILLKLKDDYEDNLVGSLDVLKEIDRFMSSNYINKHQVHWYDLLSKDEEKMLKLAPKVGVGKNPESPFVNMVNKAVWVKEEYSEETDKYDYSEDEEEIDESETEVFEGKEFDSDNDDILLEETEVFEGEEFDDDDSILLED